MSESQEALLSRMLDWLEQWSDKLSRPDCHEQLAHFVEAVGLLNAELEPTMARYLVWSNQHDAWWAPARSGYVHSITEAGWYRRTEAIDICTKALLGSDIVPNELPVRMRDILVMLEVYRAEFGDRSEQWM